MSILLSLLSLLWHSAAIKAQGPAINIDLKARVERIIAELADPSAAVREKADLKLRNLPLPAYPLVTEIYTKEKEGLDPEARSRIQSSIEMFKALAALDARVAEYWKWIRENSLTAYDEDSNRSPKWDRSAREAIALATSWPRSAGQSERMRMLFAQASDAGCEDPLFIYYHALLYSKEPDADDHKTVEMLRAAKDGVTRRYPYPAWIKCLVGSRALAATADRPDLEPPGDESAPPPPFGSHPRNIFEQQIKWEDHVPEPLLYEMAEMISRDHGTGGSEYMYDKLAKPFERLAPDSPYLQVLKGVCYGRFALAAPRDGIKGEQAAQERLRRLEIAQEALQKAYEMDPRLTIVPTEMLRILVRRGAEREEIDKWFKRAMELNPDNYDACAMMLADLPAEDKLEFARRCFEMRNFRGRLALILVLAHERLAKLSEDKTEYWHRPGVWKDIKQVYDTQLELFPDSTYDRSYYAWVANKCGQWAEADRQFKILGDKPSLKVFVSVASYNYQRKKAAKNAAAAPAGQ
jgi:tetratricopeptide (TPR) repeat protein